MSPAPSATTVLTNGHHPTAGAPDTHAVFCRGVTKTYRTSSTPVTALRGIDLDVLPGQLMMLVGPSGCGKTTLLSVIAGILNHDDGQCLVFGQDLQNMDPIARTRYRGQNIGFVFQQFHLLPTLTAAQNVAVPLLINRVPLRLALESAAQALARVGLADKLEFPPRELSGGQQQRVAIARALVHRPRLIVCDEPTSALDHETGHNVLQLLREVALGPEQSLLIVTHDSRIFEFADCIAKMDDGRVVEVQPQRSQPTGA